MEDRPNDPSPELFYRGGSMRPLFRPGDRIVFVPCRVEDLRRGDVIIFLSPGKQERVVHRVVSKGFEGIRTKGDANPDIDSLALKQEHIIGRAVSREREGRVIPVAGGLAGRLIAALICAFRKSDHVASHVLNPCYRGIARSGLFRALLPPRLAPEGHHVRARRRKGDAARPGKSHHRTAPCRRRRVDHPAALPDLRG